MIQNLGFAPIKAFGVAKVEDKSQNISLQNNQLKNDVFVRTSKPSVNAPSFKGYPYTSFHADRLANLAYQAEEGENLDSADPVGAGDLFHKRLKMVENKVLEIGRQNEAQNKTLLPGQLPKKIKKESLLNDTYDSAMDYVSNLCLQKMMSTDHDERLELHQKAESQLKRTLSIGERYFDEKAFLQVKEDLEDSISCLKDGIPIVRHILKENGEDISVPEKIGVDSDDFDKDEDSERTEAENLEGKPDGPQESEQENIEKERSFDEIMNPDDDEDGKTMGNAGDTPDSELKEHTPEEILGVPPAKEPVEELPEPTFEETMEQRAKVRKLMDEKIPAVVSISQYSLGSKEMIEEYSALSLRAANSVARQNGAGDINDRLKKGYDILAESESFLQKKDLAQLYWEQDDFKLSRSKISEMVGLKTTAKEDVEHFNTFAKVQNDKLSLKERIHHLEKLEKAPFFLGMVAMSDMHDVLSKDAICLLSKDKSWDATKQLEKIVQFHPKEEIKRFAASQIAKAKLKI